MKKILLIFLSVFAFVSVHADITWSLSDDGTLTISGTDMPNYYYNRPPSWYSKREQIKKVVIKSGVTNIGNCAFYECKSLTSVTIPNSVTSIGMGAFNSCNNLASITIPNSVTSIGVSAFYGCSSITSINIPNSVTSIGESAFYLCSGLTSIIIPNSVNNIGKFAFSDCSGLASITIPNSVTSIGEYTFHGCKGLTSIIIPNSVTSIGNHAFSSCSGLTSITIPNSVTSIGEYAFLGCTSLQKVDFESIETLCKIKYDNADSNPLYYAHHIYVKDKEITDVVIPASVTNIKKYAFYGCNYINSVTIPNSVTSIGENAFYGCSGLTSATICQSVLDAGFNSVFKNCVKLKSIELNGVTKIYYSAFKDCTKITSITIPNSVTTIGSDAFRDCTSLQKVDFESIETLCKIKYYDVNSNPLYYVHHLYVKGKEVTDVVIPASVTNIEKYAFFGCNYITSITIPNSVTSIGEDAFWGCTSLQKVDFESIETLCKIKYDNANSNPLYYAHHLYVKGKEVTDIIIPAGVNNVKKYAFYGCNYITSVTIPNSVKSIGQQAFEGCTSLQMVDFESIETLCKIDYYGANSNPLYYAHLLYVKGKEVTDVVIPASVTNIEKYAFYGCNNITSVTIPYSVTSIGENAFSACSSLTSATICQSVLDAGFNSVFKNCVKLESIVLNGVTNIKSSAFKGCTNLTSINIPNSVTNIGSDAFKDCTSLQKADFESFETLCKIKYDNADSNPLSYAHHLCVRGKEVTDVVIPAGVTNIENYAFYGCNYITSVTIPNSVASIGQQVFEGCTSLQKVDFESIETLCKIDYYGANSNPLYYAHHLYVKGKEVTDVIIPAGVTNIEKYTFYGCNYITSVTIPNSVTSIGQSAFYDCFGLEELYVEADTPPSCGNNVFMTSAYGDLNYETVKVHVTNGKKKLYLYANEWKRFTNITDDYDSEAQVEKLIKAVFDLIAAIGKIEYSDDCNKKIEAARAAYNALTAEQKALVKNYNVLVAAEEEYDRLEAATGIADINAENTIKDGKYLKNGKIIIIKNGRKYNSNGILKM